MEGENGERELLRRRIAAMRAEGMTLQAIADQLNGEGVPNPRGQRWRPSSVHRELQGPATPPDRAA